MMLCVVLCCAAAATTHSPEMGNYFQRQAMAVPADLDDPYLKKWVKPTTNPFLVQVGAAAMLHLGAIEVQACTHTHQQYHLNKEATCWLAQLLLTRLLPSRSMQQLHVEATKEYSPCMCLAHWQFQPQGERHHARLVVCALRLSAGAARRY
jgi:hypothetical protein